jgi:TrmH family RNA methyltransferase
MNPHAVTWHCTPRNPWTLPRVLTSTDNPLVKAILHLHQPRHARAAGQLLVEGRRLIADCLAAGWTPLHLLVRDGVEVPADWPTALPIGGKVAERLSQAATASGYLAVFPRPQPPPLDPARGGLVLAGVADPGNVGTLIRTAAACGLAQVAVSGGADPFAHKAIQATAGAIARIPIHLLDPTTGPAVLAAGRLCALVVSGGQPPQSLPRLPRWIVVGGEADGLTESWIGAATERCTLPMPGGTESLNAAIAGSIAMYVLNAAR